MPVTGAPTRSLAGTAGARTGRAPRSASSRSSTDRASSRGAGCRRRTPGRTAREALVSSSACAGKAGPSSAASSCAVRPGRSARAPRWTARAATARNASTTARSTSPALKAVSAAPRCSSGGTCPAPRPASGPRRGTGSRRTRPATSTTRTTRTSTTSTAAAVDSADAPSAAACSRSHRSPSQEESRSARLSWYAGRLSSRSTQERAGPGSGRVEPAASISRLLRRSLDTVSRAWSGQTRSWLRRLVRGRDQRDVQALLADPLVDVLQRDHGGAERGGDGADHHL